MRDDNDTLAVREHANRVAWTDAAVTSAWRRWAGKLADFLAQATDAMVAAAGARNGLRVLDLAAGTGDPAIALAHAVGPDGVVVATDMGADILQGARQRARDQGLDNLHIEVADAHTLGFADRSCDIVTCRFGIMYFADVGRALGQVRRVLRPGGRCVFLAWGPAEQPYFACTRGIVEKYVSLPANPSGPDTFAFAQKGALAAALGQAGFVDVSEQCVSIELCWPGPPEELWRFFQDVTAAFAEIAQRVPRDWALVTQEVLAALRGYLDGDKVTMPALVNLATGVAPG